MNYLSVCSGIEAATIAWRIQSAGGEYVAYGDSIGVVRCCNHPDNDEYGETTCCGSPELEKVADCNIEDAEYIAALHNSADELLAIAEKQPRLLRIEEAAEELLEWIDNENEINVNQINIPTDNLARALEGGKG